MATKTLTLRQLRTALRRCSAQLSAMIARTRAADAHALTIGQSNRTEFHDIVVHSMGLLRGSMPHSHSYLSMITRSYAGSVHLPEGAPSIEAAGAIVAVLNTVIANIVLDEESLSENPG